MLPWINGPVQQLLYICPKIKPAKPAEEMEVEHSIEKKGDIRDRFGKDYDSILAETKSRE